MVLGVEGSDVLVVGAAVVELAVTVVASVEGWERSCDLDSSVFWWRRNSADAMLGRSYNKCEASVKQLKSIKSNQSVPCAVLRA